MIHIIENKSHTYPPRTYANAHAADLTVAFAVDFYTMGEKLTKKAAGNKYIDLPLSIENIDINTPETVNVDTATNVDRLVSQMLKNKVNTLNIAGNGIYTLVRHGWDQERLNRYVYDVLWSANQIRPIKHIYNGGQTGVDIAGAVAAEALGINTTIHMPRGLIQRLEDGTDVKRDPKDIYREVKEMASKLLPNKKPALR